MSIARVQANVVDTAFTNATYTLSSTHFAYIYNNNSVDAVFTYRFNLSSTPGSTSKQFFISLEPHTAAAINFTLTLDALYDTAGSYPINASTSISGPGTNESATSQSVANIINPFQFPPTP